MYIYIHIYMVLQGSCQRSIPLYAALGSGFRVDKSGVRCSRVQGQVYRSSGWKGLKAFSVQDRKGSRHRN